MRLPSFEWVVPASFNEASELLKGQGPRARLLAGGTDVLIAMKHRSLTPRYLVNLKSIPGLSGTWELSETGAKIGPLTKLVEIATHPELKRLYPALAKAAGTVASYQVRNVATLGGNLCLDTKCYYYDQSSYWWNSSQWCRKRGGDRCYILPSSRRGCFALLSGDTVPALIAYKASIRISSCEGERVMALEELYTGQGMGHLDLKPGEILSEILLPPSNGTKVAFFKYVPRKTVDFATVSVAVSLRHSPSEARVILCGVASAPLRSQEAEDLLLGSTKGDIADEIGKAAASKPGIVSSVRGPVHYKREIIRLLIRDAVKQVQTTERG